MAWRNLLLFCVTAVPACGGGGGSTGDDVADDQPDGAPSTPTVDALPPGAGLYFTTRGFTATEDALFYSADAITGNTTLTGPTDDSNLNTVCDALIAMDVRPDGTVLGIGQYHAKAYVVDPTPPTKCFALGALPAVMTAMAVRPDGHIFTTDATNLYELGADLSLIATTAITPPVEGLTVVIGGMDFDASGALRVVSTSKSWMTLDTTTGALGGLGTIDLLDDFDIDGGSVVRGLTGGEYRTYNLQGNTTSGISLFGGTTYASGVVYR